MQVLVTGGAGFIGSNFVRHLLSETTVDVTTLDALTYAGSKQNLEGILDNPRHTFVEGDIRDKELAQRLVTEADVVVNFAAESHVDRSINDSSHFVSTNVEGTQTLLDASRHEDIERFVQISTDEVYGETLTGEFQEDDELNPRNPYSATKAGADLLARSYYTTYDLPVVITRASNNYGPRQHREKLIPKLITNALNGEHLPIYGDGTNVREWIFVEDHCRAIRFLMSNGKNGEIYNIGSGEELQNKDVAEKIVEAVDASPDLIEFVEDRPGHDQRYALDTTKLRNLGWEPTVPFEEGLKRTVRHYTSQK
ncbi:dTDP-glucose 4,6-dehydratase [Halogranum rubrum]|uniref:dTDP-glucose 4,6-dehydratase n=1 Tax=Halogranum salarium B-1 TaxID=1210908 RepID=J3JDZ8_9EURY|nr:dTDP-glucose 4,6-dehydratase [Halogranum salarium]EJN57924.1 dTDP-glucose 4,6-dehydratase [Halogranum salarium B-1]